MAAGVGKTYRMLEEGQAEALAGRDVVIGYLEPHGRIETMEQAAGLEVVPRRFVRYRETVLEEMDLAAVLERDAELCLIDELAHTNAPGTEHPKRYQDVEVVLATGIDVYSTVNVQHLESLNDQVAELTGTRVRETVPDAVLAAADDVVLIDITPDSLIERLLAGKVYPAERVQTALNNFFKVENLSALREVALRQVAEEVEHKRHPLESDGRGSRHRDDRLVNGGAPSAIGERLLALVRPEPASQRIVRRAWRSAQRLGAELDVLWVTAEEEPTEEESEQLAALRRLTSILGAHLLVERGPDVAVVTQRVARERGTTYVLMGAPRPRTALGRLRSPGLATRLMALLPGALAVLAPAHLRTTRRRPVPVPPPGARRILFPFLASALSQRALDAALRLARAEDATLLPVFLARVPLTLPLDAPLPRQASVCLPLQEAIEQRAAAFGVPVDARVERGRTYRHALRRTIAAERFERIVMAAASDGGPGFGPEDVAWVLANAPGEIVVLRPGAEDQLVPPPPPPRRRRLSGSGERVPARA